MAPLSVVLTRTESDAHHLSEQYPQFNWIEFPLIKFEYQALSEDLFDEINDNYDWLVFTSQNGVKAFFEQNQNLENKYIACVGPKTAGLVQDYGHEVNFVPSVYTSLTLANELPLSENESVVYIGGNLSNYETLGILKEKSKHFMQVESYHTVSHHYNEAEWKKFLSQNLSLISFASPSAVTSFVSQLEKYHLDIPQDIKYAAIGTTTQAAIKDDLDMTAIIGEKHTFASMIEKIVMTLSNDKKT
ncbi:uroporphyrinogen-III synthase [Portibacter lacus]|uniref:Uroporphyrinogen-III synthase n=1 Tax=Portibacter lacus TaxID=1099794 RepID=A0AA37SRC7_9BACT|nr:uroporphyrinogen-III synthase [Portibacter lacus]GLR18319.1 uroporphyrinogen-III synthase [Portibacter lacus]